MQELQERELQMLGDQTCLLYLYTPFCGTCQLAGTMLGVIDKLMTGVPFYKNNLNYSPTFAEQQKIKSVPCLVIYKKGKIVKKEYAFHSVSYLYDMIKQIIAD
ncbi:thioredoxin family protein [Bacillus sp. WMMC1349]|uniref:thioredoxin family protein n=1 Tax=Bacillus sp. WMMC1349 TaxID=2736254 RepID=UPI0015578CD5|nr:thioredoxin family protein [Bacillus sp. WMMC1349]NPC94102.1 thioredoxin family protein [Bacillus sp. WMMC1349]